MAVALCEESEGIDEAGVHEILEPRALLVRETLLAAVRFRIREIEFGVRDVEITAEDHGLLLVELFAVGEECGIPVFMSQLEPREVVLGVRSVDRDDVKLLELGGDHTSFIPRVALELVGERELLGEAVGKAVDDLERFLLREDSRARITLFLAEFQNS